MVKPKSNIENSSAHKDHKQESKDRYGFIAE